MVSISDVRLHEAAATTLAMPRAAAPDSFVLHAPLELLARAALLPFVSPSVRDTARDQIRSIAVRFDESGPPAEPDDMAFGHVEEAIDALRSAVADGDLPVAGAAGRVVGETLDAERLIATVGDLLTPSLAAAAHGPIFLHHLPRSIPRSPVAGSMFGTLAREVARNPDWKIRWHDDGLDGTDDLATALASTPVLGEPDSTFIHPLMVQAEESGLAADLIGRTVGPTTDAIVAAQAILRTASASMLLDDPAHAPYGWSHCLTIPQGVLATLGTSARPDHVLAIAATHVVGFRAALGSAPLDTFAGPAGPIGHDALVPGIERPDDATLQTTIDFAATHEDAHLTKYLVSCMDAARGDPLGAHQHLAAAVHLAEWWRTREP